MLKIILDSNIYDRLESDLPTVKLVQSQIEAGALIVLMPRQVATELRDRDSGFPRLFPIKIIGHAVARAGVMCAGDFLGSGEIFDAHRGESSKDADAFIVDVAAQVADWFVSEDRRSLNRFPKNAMCKPLRYDEFVRKLEDRRTEL